MLQESDFAPYLFQTSRQLLERTALTNPVWIFDVSLLQKFPAEESRLKIEIKPFSPMVF